MLWIKAFHLMAMVTWFAGIFYLPRLFVYHAMTEDEPGRERFRTMERKLYRGIMNPSMIATLLFGTWLIALNPALYLQQGWLHVKLVLIAVLVAYHLWCGYYVRLFRDDRNTQGHVFFRVINEAPVLLLVAIILLAVVRPF
ncbi:protoporphyrinogen oxidase HemJ [Salicola sp. Rm-C-2C1-2]|uniref:protoporphyrinogen oxidase HemJ n=1 Tax=Salicola sp. Rm-C-2C1-2 TaxID=3141321 RepID=UPI0032E4A06D